MLTPAVLALTLLLLLSCTASPAAAPQIQGVVNSASFTKGIAPGSLISIFGSDLDATQEQSQTLPLPIQFSGVSVNVNGVPVPLLYASPTQINAQLPFNVSGNATVQVITPDGSAQTTVTIADVAPAVFAVPSATASVAAAVHANGTLVSPDAPAQPGEAISLFVTGLGAVNGAITAGQGASGSPLLWANAPVEVKVGGFPPAIPQFAGLAPGFAGLYQINFQVPALAGGTYDLSIVAGTSASAPVTLPVSNAVHHYEYVFPDGSMYVYDMDNGFNLVKQINLPQAQAIRGIAIGIPTHTLYISYGGDGGGANGSMLAYDLLTDNVMWTVNYPNGVDSPAITPDGKRIYLPEGELDLGKIWNVIDASNGNIIGTISAGAQPHNTAVSLDGTRVYMGPRGDNYLYVAETATNALIGRIGPLLNGVRPFTINGRQTLAFTTATGFLGFEVSDINSGNVLYRVPVAGFSVPAGFPATAPSHGISLSPDEQEVWVMDAGNSYVHVFDVSGLPGTPPRQVADIALTRPMGGLESVCSYDCVRDGWVQHSMDGRFVFVGDSGDVISTTTRKAVVNLDPLYNTRKHIEIDWQNGVPIATSTREGLGHIDGVSH